MRYHKPDIIVVLALLVSVGVVVTTSAQAGETDATVHGGAGMSDNELHPLPGLSPCVSCASGGVTPSAAGLSVHDYPYHLVRLDYHANGPLSRYTSGKGYSVIMTGYGAVAHWGMGGVDLMVRLDSILHSAARFDPYLSVTLGRRW